MTFFRHSFWWLLFIPLIVIFGIVLPPLIGPYFATIITYAGINIILAISLNLVNGFAGQFSMGHAGFMAVGAYTSAILSLFFFTKTPFIFEHSFGREIFFTVVIILAGVMGAFFGFLVGIPSLRLRGDYLAIVTLGFGEMIRVIFLNIQALGGARGLPGIPALTHFTNLYLWVLISLFILWRISISSHGREFLSVREDEIAAEAMGVPTTRAKLKAFILSSFFAGVAGGLFAHSLRYINPGIFDFNRSFEIIIMVVLGGMGSFTGSVIAATLLTFLRESLRPLQELTHVDFRMVIYSLVLIFTMILKPKGLLGHQELIDFLPKAKKKIKNKIKKADFKSYHPERKTSEVLQLENVSIFFGGLQAVTNLSLSLSKGHIYGLIGPNGAGKTTVFNMITGIYRPTSGSIKLWGKKIKFLKPHQVTSKGIVRTFQNLRLFKQLSVLENVIISLDHHPEKKKKNIWATILQTKSVREKEEAKRIEALNLLDLFDLAQKSEEKAQNLSYGDEKRLEMARAIATGAELLLLDEPVAGLNAQETAELMTKISELRDRLGITVLIIEHDMKFVMGICERIVVLDYGVKIAEGTPEEVRKNPKVIEAYLGKETLA